jgi:hypothetical protein
MTGGLMQLVAQGAQDGYITTKPEVTYFKALYKRHTNFAMEPMEHNFSGQADFGRKPETIIPRNADVLLGMVLMVKLAKVTISGDTSTMTTTKFAWCRRLGHAMISSVTLEIGGSLIEKHYGDWLNIWYELSHAKGQEEGYAKMIGDVDALTSLDTASTDCLSDGQIKPAYTLYVPMQFSFCRTVGLAIPLIALQYHDIKVRFDFLPAAQLCCYTGSISTYGTLKMDDASLLLNFGFLDVKERTKYSRVPHEYLIEQLQFSQETVSGSTIKPRLQFNHPTKEMIFAPKNGDFITGKKFLAYSHSTDWAAAVNEAAKNLVLGGLNLTAAGIIDATTDVTGWTEIAKLTGTTYGPVDGTIDVTMPEVASATGYPTLALRLDALTTGTFNLMSKISEITLTVTKVGTTYVPDIETVVHTLTLRDVSRALSRWTDNRNDYGKKFDVVTRMHHNYGLLLDGTKNPIYDAQIVFNGIDRLAKRDGAYFNYVQPYQHHTNIPCDGINVYSFALNPEQHQPSGTANLSRIDTTQLNMTFADASATVDTTSEFRYDLVNEDTVVNVYVLSYNIFRIVGGMGGMAYTN